mmetsp:Transcript_63440/g.138136  ORF Transcript_63440/g.138136 Transcript_63440/m.138136 type:complete len:608 (+) Transcript_63440:43-1866(+)
MACRRSGDSAEDSDSDGSLPELVPAEATNQGLRVADVPPNVDVPVDALLQHVNFDDAEAWDSSTSQTTLHCQPCSDEQAEQEYGYPTWPEEMKNPNFFAEELHRMRTDPRYNKNLLLDPNSQEYWNEAARAPWAKVLLRREEWRNERRSRWLYQAGHVEEMNKSREEVAELLENCSMQVKRLVAPMLRYKPVESLLWTVYSQAKQSGLPFEEFVERADIIEGLQSARQQLDRGGEHAATLMQEEADALVEKMNGAVLDKRRMEDRERGRVTIDMTGLKAVLEYAQKCKKDGLVEWERQNWDEALLSWQQGDDVIRRFRAPMRSLEENELISELHGALLRNMAQAALKLERWREAAAAAERALELDDQDHKGWFRRACALEGLGRLEEAQECLTRIDEIAVGRPDRARLVADTQRRRAKLSSLQERHGARQRRMLQKSLATGVFGGKEEATPQRLDVDPSSPSPIHSSGERLPTAPAPVARRTAAEAAKTLTREGARDLLAALQEAYSNTRFVQRVDKLIGDMRFDVQNFLAHHGRLALEVQGPILRSWGFEASETGVAEMTGAIAAHTEGPFGDPQLRRQAAVLSRALCGSPELGMYERVRRAAVGL